MKKIYFLILFCFGFYLHAQTITIPDINFKNKLLAASTTTNIAYNAAGVRIKIDANNNGSIQANEALLVYRLEVSSSNITDLTGIESFTNLKKLNCSYNQLTNLNINPLINLQELNCYLNSLTNLNISNLSTFNNLNCGSNDITTLNLSNLPNLIYLDFSFNEMSSVDLSNVPSLKTILCINTNISTSLTSLNLLAQQNLEKLDCSGNNITALELFLPNPNLVDLNIKFNDLTNFNFNDFPSLELLTCGSNPYVSFNIDSLVNLRTLDMSSFPLNVFPFTSGYTNAGNFIHLENLVFERMNFLGQLNFDFGLFPALQFLSFRFCDLTEISLDIPTLKSLNVTQNPMTSIDLTNLPNLESFAGHHVAWESIIFNYDAPLQEFYCYINPTLNITPTITSLDFSSFPSFQVFYLDGWQQLQYLNIKNGNSINSTNSTFSNCPNLQYICSDDDEVNVFQTKIASYAYSICHVNTYCTFEPGGTFYTIQGDHQFDIDNNGCDANDYLFSNMKFNISSGTNTTTLISGNDGSYHYDVPVGTYTVTPVFENPSYYTVSPATVNVTFPTTASPFTQNFCLTSNVGTDLQVILLPITVARPGFDNKYKIIYKNVGGIPVNGSVNFTFNDAINDLVESIPIVTSQSTNNLNWSFTNLLPFESREIIIKLNLNSPTESPAVNSGDVMNFIASLSSSFTDLTTNNNTLVYNQTVVNAYDPNDKTCLDGTTITPDKVGEYVHYLIRFENNGTANAQNIVVKDIIDTAKYDIATLIPLDGSHDFHTRITNTNQVEFIFENINLPFDDTNNDGYVAFKIKTKSNLNVGSTFSNTANIYFDYNFPIVTNTATTTIQALGNSDFEFNNYFTLSPVPTKDTLSLESNQDITVSSISIYNTLGQLILVETNPSNQIDVSNLKTGNYFIKVITDKGSSVGKFIKQ